MKSLLFLLLMTCSGSSAWAQGKLKPLLFQADKNNLQVLPQRFEYSLIDENRLKVGDVLVDTTQVGFHLEQADKKGTYKLRFKWPAGLLKNGELAIKNNSGKAIFTAPIQSKSIKITEKSDSDNGTELRLDLAEFISDEVSKSLLDDMKYLPFMVFCIYRESEETRIYLCSKELFLTTEGNTMEIRPRTETKKTAQVEINGKVVGNQGIIYLNDPSENVSFRSYMQTGSFLEIETRMKPVDFKDVVSSPDGKKLILTASGAEPVDEKRVKKISATDWMVEISQSRPLIYLKGEGDIPMRQEFYIKGPLPIEKHRPFLSARSPSETYASDLQFLGVAPEGVQIQANENDPQSIVNLQQKNRFQWTLKKIPPGISSRRYLQVTSGTEKFLAGFDITRGLPMSLSLSGAYQTPSGQMYAHIDYQWWFENFLGMSSAATRFHWGLGLDRSQLLAKVDGEANADLTTLELLWRANAGFHLFDETWGLSLPLQMVQGEDASTTSYGFGYFLHKKAPRWATSYMDWNIYKLRYFAGSTGGDFKVSSSIQASAEALVDLKINWKLLYGLKLSQMKFDPSAEKEDFQVGLEAGILYQF